MNAYWSDGRGRYGTGESYDYFWMLEDEEACELFTSSDGLWTYWLPEDEADSMELLRYNGSETHIQIPAEIDGRKVTSLACTFDGFYELKSVEIPEGVVSIEGAFYGCENLEEVRLPKGLEDMSHAFDCCYSLRQIQVPGSVTDFSYAFKETALEHFAFPQGTRVITGAFLGCSSLKQVTIPKTVNMSDEAFSDCEALECVELEEGIEKLDDYIFFDCPSLKELKIPVSVKEFGEKSAGMMEVREYDGDEDALIRAYRIKGYEVVPGFRIVGVQGSAAERYADEQGIPFTEG